MKDGKGLDIVKGKGKGKMLKEMKDAKEIKGDTSSKNESKGVVIPVCLGEFDHKDVETIKELWEKTWSADSRSKKK